MQQFRIGAAAHGGGEIVTVAGSAGVELFTVGTDNTVWNFYPDPTSATGYSGMSTGMVAGPIGAGVDSSGKIVLFAGNNKLLNYVVQTGRNGAKRWGAVQNATLPANVRAIAVAAIYTSRIGGQLYVGVLSHVAAQPDPSYAFSFAIWDQSPAGAFTTLPGVLSTLNCVWSGATAASAEFTCLDVTHMGFSIPSGTLNRYPVTKLFRSKAVATAVDAASAQHYYAVLADGDAYELIGGAGTGPAAWSRITQGAALRDISAHADGDGAIHLLVLGADNGLIHIAPKPTGGWFSPATIQSGAAQISSTPGSGGDIILFILGTAPAALTRMIRENGSGDWQTRALEIPTLGTVEEFSAYATDVRVTDAAGAVMPGAAIQVWASSQTELIVNGSVYLVDPQTPANLVANASGMLAIIQQTGSLGAPALQILVGAATSAGQAIAVRQAAGTQARLAAVTGDDLMNATVADGTPLLGVKYRTPTTTAELALAFSETMKLAAFTEVALDEAAFDAHARRAGVGPSRIADTARLNRLRASPDFRPWHIDFTGGEPVFAYLTDEAAQALMAEKRATHAEAAGLFGSLGDLIAGIAEGAVNVLTATVSVVKGAITATITFIVDGVNYLMDVVIDTVERAFDLAETIFAKVKVFFEQAFEWLGFIFNWGDIKRSRTAIVYTVNQYLILLEGAATGVKRGFDAGLAGVIADIDTVFDKMLAAIGTASPGGYINQNRPNAPKLSASTANNFVFTHMIDNIGASTSITALTAGERAEATLDPIIAQFQQFAAKVRDLPEFAQALTYFTSLGGSPDAIFSQLLSGFLLVLKGLAKALSLGLQAIVDSLIDLLASMVGQIRTMLSEEWKIPFVSDFYKWLTGDDLTLIDLFALVLAIPATVAFKLLQRAAPFPDDASVTAFTSSFTGQSLLTASGLGASAPETPGPAAARAEGIGAVAISPRLKFFLAAVGGGCTYYFGVISACLDAQPVPSPITVWGSRWALAFESFGQAVSVPWISDSSPPLSGRRLWLVETTGVVIDALWIVKEGKVPENDGDIGTTVACMYALLHGAMVATYWDDLDNATRVSKVAILIPEGCKFLRFSSIASGTGNRSLFVLAALDTLGYLTSGMAAAAAAVPPPEPPSPPTPTRAMAPAFALSK